MAIPCILYPPTLNYHYLFQRPQHLMQCFGEMEIPSIFLNMVSYVKNHPCRISQVGSHLVVVDGFDPRAYLSQIHPVVYYSSPAQVDLVKEYHPSLVVYDSVDEPSEEFVSWKPYYRRAVTQADMVLAASEKLYHSALELNPRTYLVPNGCDFNYFSKASQGFFPVPAELKNMKGPIIGYIGVMASWCDFELIIKISEAFPQAHIVMIGPLYNVSRVPQAHNIHWLGFKPYQELAAYLQCFRAAIIPFQITSMTRAVNPIKMWEYLAAGVPVVTTALPEAQFCGSEILISYDRTHFIQNLQLALNEDPPGLKESRLDLARRNSWMKRARQAVELISDRLLEKYANRDFVVPSVDQICAGLQRGGGKRIQLPTRIPPPPLDHIRVKPGLRLNLRHGY